jgi:catechol 2,3-dioxygenase-like lactoylglutathione lyase family enzyme
MLFGGVGHLALTVTDLRRSISWYERVLGWSALFEGDGDGVRFAVGTLPGGVMMGLREYDAGDILPFDPTRVGLDHLALVVPAEDLDGWQQRFSDLDVVHDRVQDTPIGLVLNFKDPDGIALELTAPRGERLRDVSSRGS